MKELFLMINPISDEIIFNYKSENGIDTKIFIESLYQSVYKLVVEDINLPLVDKETIENVVCLQKKFELNKVIYNNYALSWKEGFNDEVSVDLYRKFLLVLLFSFHSSGDIRFLNTGLKVIDKSNRFQVDNLLDVNLGKLYNDALINY